MFIFPADNGLNPVYNDTIEFDVMCPPLAYIRFAVYNEDMFGDPNFVAQAVFPFESLRLGTLETLLLLRCAGYSIVLRNFRSFHPKRSMTLETKVITFCDSFLFVFRELISKFIFSTAITNHSQTMLQLQNSYALVFRLQVGAFKECTQ